MASRTAADVQQLGTAPTIPGFSMGGGGGGGSGSSDSFSGIENPEALKMLMEYLNQQIGGGTAEEKAMRAERMKQITQARGVTGDYSKAAAFSDATDLMAQNLRQSMERNMPVINKAIQGAGTSASSMQALLSQKLATESAQAAGAMGAEQAKSYGGIQAQLQGVLEALTRADPSNSQAIIGALSALKNSRSSSTQTQAPTNPTFSVTHSGGGSMVMPSPSVASIPSTPAAAPMGYWDFYTGNTHAGDKPQGADSNGMGAQPVNSDTYNPYSQALSDMYQNNQNYY